MKHNGKKKDCRKYGLSSFYVFRKEHIFLLYDYVKDEMRRKTNEIIR